MFVLSLVLLLAPAPETPPKPGVIVLGAEANWYKDAKGEETPLQGTLEANPGTGRGQVRFNAYRLSWIEAGKTVTRDLYLPEKAYLLLEHVGKPVRIVGKKVETELGGKTFVELWPARLELVGVAGLDMHNPDGIRARCGWQPNQARVVGPHHYVIRDARELAKLREIKGSDAAEETAVAAMARDLGLKEIDWKKFLLVSVCAGLRTKEAGLKVTRVVAKERVLTVYYRLIAADGDGGFGYPAETVLVDRFDGEVKFEQEK